jgi:hypothetical protein
VHANGADTVGVLAVVSVQLARGEVVDLVLVSHDVDDYIVFQQAQIVAFVGALTKHGVEFQVSARNSRILQLLFNMIAFVKLVHCHLELGLFFFLLLSLSSGLFVLLALSWGSLLTLGSLVGRGGKNLGLSFGGGLLNGDRLLSGSGL